MKKKLTLNELVVTSFITKLEDENSSNIQGGAQTTDCTNISQKFWSLCNTCGIVCNPDS